MAKRINNYYMAVTADEFELPVGVADSPKELAALLKVSRSTIFYKFNNEKSKNWKVLKIEV